MSGATVTVVIGRKVGGVPMLDAAWRDFQALVTTAVDTGREGYYHTGPGIGWSENWGHEETYVVIAPVADAARLPRLREALSALARNYGQEAVVLMVTPEPEFVSPPGGRPDPREVLEAHGVVGPLDRRVPEHP